MDHLLFCVNHPEKIAKRHCKKCDQNLCNECVFDSHIEHHEDITKLEYSIDAKKTNFENILTKDIKLIIEKTLEELKPKIYQQILEKTEKYIKDHKNLQLKLNQNKEKLPVKKEAKTKPIKKDEKPKPNHPDNKEPLKTKTSSNIKERAKMFGGQNNKEIPKHFDINNPINKGQKGNVNKMAKLFEHK